MSHNGTSVELRARVSSSVREGVVRIAQQHAGELGGRVEVRESDRGLVGLADQGRRDHQPGHAHVRVHDLGRAQGAGADAAALRAEPRGPVRPAAADRRPGQADPQGELLPGLRRRHPLHHGAGALVLHRAPRLQRDPVRPRLADRRLLRERAGRERPDLADPAVRAQLARDLRLHRRRLGLRLEVLAARLDAHLRADGLVRGLADLRGARRRADGPVALARRHRPQAERDDLVLRARSSSAS